MKQDKIKRYGQFLNEEIDFNDSSMKELIIQALDDTYAKLKKNVSQTKMIEQTKSIMGVKPTELISFMKSNNIPDDAEFSGTPNGYDGYEDFVLSWVVSIPTTDVDKEKEIRDRFNNNMAWQSVKDVLSKNGYVRSNSNSSLVSQGLLKEFRNTTVYDMYMKKDFDKLTKYYSLSFVKEV